MQNTVLQNNLIDALDNVMLRAEEIVTNDTAMTQLNMHLLKSDVRNLYKIICQIELAEFSPAECSHQQTVGILRQELEELKQAEEMLHTQEAGTSPKNTEPEVLSEPNPDFQTELTAEPAVANAEDAHSASVPQESQTKIENAMPDNTDKPADMPATEPDTAEQCPENPTEAQTQTPELQNKTPELPFAEEEFQQSSLENVHTAIEPEQETAEPETAFSNAQVLSDFMPTEEDPQSYVTEITAMVQANTKEQDMSQVAVSSTAMPDEKVARIVSNRWNTDAQESQESEREEKPSESSSPSPAGIFGKLKETEAMNRATNPTNLKSLFEKLKPHKTVNDVQQHPIQDLKSLIGLNEKFLFINKLFKGNIDDYRKMIEMVDKAASRQEMEEIISPLEQQYQWDPESLAYITLFDLLNKKFPEA